MSPSHRPSPQTPLPSGEGLSRNHTFDYVRVLAIALRKRETPAEKRLWQALRNRGLADLKFRRQYPAGRYILDFYCHERQLAVELNGFHHFNPARRAYDLVRTRYLEGAGIRIIRFTNTQVNSDLPRVLRRILLLSPLPRGEGQG